MMSLPIYRCLFCGEDASGPDHLAHCDGRQGRAEAFTFDSDPVGAYAPHEHVRTTDPDTSHEAAWSVTDATVVQARVVAIYEAHPAGLTDEELVAAYARDWPGTRSLESRASPRKRRSDLARAGVLIDTGERRTLTSGRRGIVWTLHRRPQEVSR
jgi:hypothetical protein